MRRLKRVIATASLLLTVLLAACATPSIDLSPEAAGEVRDQDLGSLPYHPIAYHMDLSILSYQLYSQSLVWPFDPYYEDLDNETEQRAPFMAAVHAWAETKGEEQVAAAADTGDSLEAYRGPGALGGFPDNAAHDPILYQYSRLHPWSTSITMPLDRWIEYRTPTAITEQIRDVYVCNRTTGGAEGEVSLHAVPARRDDAAPDARDILMAFEGGTGDKGEEGQPPSQSLMGFALLRSRGGDAYDVHIAFRGSRSGSGARAALAALSSDDAMGNPDWITDLGYDEVEAPFITTTGTVSRGMSRSLQSIFPQLYHCLDHVVGRERTVAPTNIYVTGHSLGGGLAQHFVSALFMGEGYGPDGAQMPESIRDWPWRQTKLISFSAPRVGSEDWARELTVTHLGAQFFRSRLANPYDLDATGVTNLEILPRLIDANAAAGYRVLLPTDPITSGRIPGGMPVGTSVYLEEPGAFDAAAPPDFEAHDPFQVRRHMLETLRDPRIPASAWAYHEMEDLNPMRTDAAAGSQGEYQKLGDAVRSYYSRGDVFFDVAAFDAGFETFVGLIDGL